MVAPGARAYSTLLRRSRPFSPQAFARTGRWLVLAPHPDDETLGTGAMIATLAQHGHPPCIAFLTDGARSHVGAPGWPARRISAARRGEAAEALRVLGMRAPALHLDWPDAAPLSPNGPDFRASARRLAVWCRRHRIDHLAVTWSGEPHCDHGAAAALAHVIARCCHVRLFYYMVWGWTDPDLIARTRPLPAWSVATGRGRPAQRRALSRHRTQLGGRISGGESFRLPRTMEQLVDRPRTILLEAKHAT